MYIKIKLDPDDWTEILRLGNQTGKVLNSRTVMTEDDKHHFAGAAGEWAVGYVYKNFIPSKGNWHHDYLWGSKKIEVKTRSGGCEPRPDFDARMFTRSYRDQNFDIAIFGHALWTPVEVGQIISHVFLVGWLTKEEFGRKADARKAAGAKTEHNGYRPRADMMVVRNEELNQDLRRFLP